MAKGGHDWSLTAEGAWLGPDGELREVVAGTGGDTEDEEGSDEEGGEGADVDSGRDGAASAEGGLGGEIAEAMREFVEGADFILAQLAKDGIASDGSSLPKGTKRKAAGPVDDEG